MSGIPEILGNTQPITQYQMIFKTEQGWVKYQRNVG